MDFIEELQNLSDTIKEYSDQDLDEANTETFCFEPFIELLGFRRNPVDMQKQYPADIRGGPKTVDYAIKKDGVPIMIVECKPLGDNLDAHTGQLSDYFTAVRGTRFGVLTDGRLYRFYTDLDSLNLMDSDPFLEIDLLDIQPSLVAELERYSKPRFDLDKALAAARDLKYSEAIRQFLTGQLESPTEDFVNYITSAINIAINTQEQRQQITEIIQRALKAFKGEETDEPPPPWPDPDPEPAIDETAIDWMSIDWTGKQIRAFTFNGEPYKVKNWTEFLTKFCEILSKDHPDQFEGVLQLNPQFFSKKTDTDSPKGISPKNIEGTNIYVETNINNKGKKKIVIDLVKHFGYNLPVLYIDEN